VYIIIFVRNPSLEDDSDEKVGLFLYPDNLEQTVASYRGRIKIRFLRNTLRSNLRSMSTIIFVRNPSLEDDSDEWRNLKPNNSPCFETKATNLNSTHFNITFYKKKKFGLFLYLDNLEQSVASYRGRTKVKNLYRYLNR
jgi:hypothetical protein